MMGEERAMTEIEFESYVGRVEETSGVVEGTQLDLMAAIFDKSWDECAPYNFLPPLWHWLLFQSPVRQSSIGADGHPKRGGFMPPISLPRRMFAGARLEFIRPLRRGEAVTRKALIKSITPKSGRSGNLVFVTVSYEIAGDDGIAIKEEQDIVFREPALANSSAKSAPTALTTAASSYPVEEILQPDPVMLFRFSAATGNSHRIHYDQSYSRDEEGYPDLVVHGPLQAIWLADMGRRHLGRELTTFSFKGLKPAFVNRPLRGGFRSQGESAELAVLDEGAETLTAQAR
jgi:3-methylfumaryl-CoA hydratase